MGSVNNRRSGRRRVTCRSVFASGAESGLRVLIVTSGLVLRKEATSRSSKRLGLLSVSSRQNTKSMPSPMEVM